MSGSRPPTRRFLLDNNVFVAAIHGRGAALRLLLALLKDPDAVLVGNLLLLDEMTRHAAMYRSPAVLRIHAALAAKMRMIDTEDRFLRACIPHLDSGNPADLLLAATALQEGAIIVTNDNHFQRLKASGAVEVWSLSEAIERILEG